ncbi:hypothetical protein [Limosilactobacillus fermentum]|uniref:hypothetical protein n=1 Tax=Limosilactobacillus fermentum TaxID=1613 RepID=UPI0009776778|nr:hypothetical protein [Limosilactobacillus fermentum]
MLGMGSKLSRANRPIQNRIGDGRKIELVIEEPNSGLLIEQLEVEQFTEGRRIALSPSRIAIQSEFKPP